MRRMIVVLVAALLAAFVYISLIGSSDISDFLATPLGILTLNLTSVAIGAIIGPLLARLWHEIWIQHPGRQFWKLTADPLYAVSLRDFDVSEDTPYIPTGDAMALSKIDQSLERLYPQHETDLYTQPQEPYRDWSKDVVLVGGGLSNITTRCLLAALNPPLDARDHKYPDFNYKGLTDTEDEPVCDHKENQTFTNTNGTVRLKMDWGFVIRAPDPRRRNKNVFIIAGGYTIGTYAAAHWVSQPNNLRWLWWQNCKRRLQEFTRLRWKSERDVSLQVLLKVTVPHIEPYMTSTVTDADIEEWDQNTGCWVKEKRLRGKPIYFQTPSNYTDKYYHWANIASSEWSV